VSSIHSQAELSHKIQCKYVLTRLAVYYASLHSYNTPLTVFKPMLILFYRIFAVALIELLGFAVSKRHLVGACRDAMLRATIARVTDHWHVASHPNLFPPYPSSPFQFSFSRVAVTQRSSNRLRRAWIWNSFGDRQTVSRCRRCVAPAL